MRHRLTIFMMMIFVTGCGAPPPEPVTRPDVDRTGWRKLAKGMTPDRVRQLLGEPMKVEKQGAVTCWHYQESRPLERDADNPNSWVLSRGSLLFSAKTADTEKLTAWREP
jgi:hypothetical protein